MTNSKTINWLHNKIYNWLLLTFIPRPSGSTHTIWQTSNEFAQYLSDKQAAIESGAVNVLECGWRYD
jgi:hypothetical protein